MAWLLHSSQFLLALPRLYAFGPKRQPKIFIINLLRMETHNVVADNLYSFATAERR